MAVLCDFVYLDDTKVTKDKEGILIGEATPLEGWTSERFDAGGRRAGPAILMLMVKGLTHAHQPPQVLVNHTPVGNLQPYRPKLAGDEDVDEHQRHQEHWYTQYLVFEGSTLHDNDNNVVTIRSVGFKENTATNLKDDFRVRDIVCWFHQAS